MWRRIRIAVLLLVLFMVATQALFDRHTSRDWTTTLRVGLHPLNADGSDVAERYIAGIGSEYYEGLEAFFAREGAHYGLPNDRLVQVDFYPRLERLPPPLVRNPGMFDAIIWSLRMRWYAWRAPDGPGQPSPNVRLFVMFHDPEISPTVPHSVGLSRGLTGVVHAFASRAQHGSNEFIIAHELMHTVGAADRYDLGTGLPFFPDGFAEPELDPLLPQRQAEIMGGRIPITEQQAETPYSLDDVIVGPITAREIAWTPREPRR
jgi:hypothetical protein